MVPGDLITFGTGDRIPADLRLTQAHSLEIDESALTGETHPARKHSEAIEGLGHGVSGLPISERNNIAFMGTLVRNGRGEGIVVGTGEQSEFGVVFAMMQEVCHFCGSHFLFGAEIHPCSNFRLRIEKLLYNYLWMSLLINFP